MFWFHKEKNPNERRILITGGCGCGGSSFATFELNSDNQVYIIDLMTSSSSQLSAELLKKNPNAKKLKIIKGDICNGKLVYKLLKKYKIDWLVHFAAEDTVLSSIKDAANYMKNNIYGTYEVLNAALKYYKELYGDKKDQFRFHHVSTDEVFGDLPMESTELFTEESLYNPSNPYSSTKASADLMVKAWNRTYSLPITLSYCSNIFGPGQNHDRFVAKVIVKLVNRENMPLYNQGKDLRNWLFVEEHSRAIHLIITKGKIGEAYCIGSDDNKTTSEVAEVICNYLKTLYKDKIDYSNFVQVTEEFHGEDHRHAVDCFKLRNELDFQNEYQFEDAIQQTINWYLKNYNISSHKGENKT